MPYDIEVADWDVLLSDMMLEMYFQQLVVTNRARAHCLVLGCVWYDAGRIGQRMVDSD